MKTKMLNLLVCFLALLIVSNANAQSDLLKVRGTVYDEKGETVIGAEVRVKNANQRIITDVNGTFAIEVPKGSVLQISYVGCETQEILAVAGEMKIVLKYVTKDESLIGWPQIGTGRVVRRVNITAATSANSVVSQNTSSNNVVVSGYGTTKKRDLVTSTSLASAQDLKNVPVTSAAEALQGKLAGVTVTQTEGSPDATTKIRVRGGGGPTVCGGALYVVDGKIVPDISDIQPKDIQLVDVLKDAAATAIYGSQGADGVIIITTKHKKHKIHDFFKRKRRKINPSPQIQNPAPVVPQVQVSNVINDEEYKATVENTFKDVKKEPLSTFSLDVDPASYSNVRRQINEGVKPNKYSVRVEEFVNYFKYNYKQPTDANPVKINAETHTCPWNKEHLLVRVGVKAKEISAYKLPASNFVFLIDVSGSMDEPNKLPLVKSSLKLLTNNLRAKDRVAIVVYAGAAGVVLPSTSGDDKQTIMESIDRLQAGGSTAGGAGIEMAYQIAQENFVKGGNNRIILCTDGDFNVGVSSEDGLEQLIEAKRQTGVYLTVLGYGMGNYKDNKMQALSQKGNGNNAYIDNIQEANKVLVNEFSGTMFTVAKDVKLQVEFNPAKVRSYRLVGYETRMLNKEDFNNDAKDAGELGSGHTVTAFYELVPAYVRNNSSGVDKLKYQKNIEDADSEDADISNELMTVKLRYKPTDGDKSLLMEVPITGHDINQTPSVDYNFASSVAMFAQLLRESEYKGTSDYKQVVDLAKQSMGDDIEGYRHEFVRLVEAVDQMGK